MNGTTITVAGNIATDPEQRSTAGGVPYTRFRIACGERRRDKTTGEWADAGTNWYTVSVFRSLGENAARSLRKGQRVLVSGRLRIRNWETAQNHGTEAEIDAEAIGHDLRWGTTTFEKTAHAGGAPSSPSREWENPSVPRTDDAVDAGWPLVTVPAGDTAESHEEVPY
ncbi:single-stranded DNA-binding protein [Microbacterium sp. NPDC055910]|uniref:single-stranded DNA-binding protein n=1 Tax=Microbacterium sp. NPDC055910 TaxID=3345659 RepID=UPI0035D983C9